ncbi:MAG: ATP-binding protein, partial [Bdellovibrionales bacterium]
TDPSAITAFRHAVHMYETTTLDVLVYRKDGSPFWSEWHLTPLMGEDGKVAYFVSLLNDTTAFRQTQEDLMRAKATAEHASAVKSTFLATMSHEIRTPINGVLGILKLMDETDLDDEQRHLLGIAKTSSNVLHGIINDILDYAKMEAGKIEIIPEPFDIRQLLNDLACLGRSLLGDKKVVLTCDIDPTVPDWCVADVGRLRQIILNLMSNAIKFTENGSISIRVLSLLQQEVDGKPGHLLRFEVQDTGLGISQEDQRKLFQEFSQVERTFTRRFGGTGLGLAICRRLIGLMNGEISVDSQPGKGSRFWFILPIGIGAQPDAKERAENATQLPAGSPEMLASMTLLLAEDNETNRLVARRYIEKIGMQVDEAVNGREAVDKAMNKHYDVILMDVSMPVMDGMMATHHIRGSGEYNASVPIIALTAHAMEGDRHLCLAAGMNDYLQKPINNDQLRRVLERWLSIRLPVEGETIKPMPAQPEPQRKEPSHRTDEIPVLSDDVLQIMEHDLGRDVVLQVSGVFLDDSAHRVAEFATASSLLHLRDLAHTLKSCSANCGLTKFSRLMARIEELAIQENADEIEALKSSVLPFYQEACDALKKRRESMKI